MDENVEPLRLKDLTRQGRVVADDRGFGNDDRRADGLGASGRAGRMGILQDLHVDKDAATPDLVAPDVGSGPVQNRGEW